jgi:tetratricopeptide (TPR) repeat protein
MKYLPQILITLLLAHTASATDSSIIKSPAYKECIGLASSNPGQALTKADSWLAVDRSISAHHCRAMALYGLKRYPEAGESLDAVRNLINKEDVELRSFVTKQSVTAWTNAGRMDAALGVLDAQLAEMHQSFGNNAAVAKQTSGLLLERARINLTYGKAKLATQDLDHAISLTPTNADLLIERARAFEMLGDVPLMRADIESALTLSPGNAKARAMLAKIDSKGVN